MLTPILERFSNNILIEHFVLYNILFNNSVVIASSYSRFAQ